MNKNENKKKQPLNKRVLVVFDDYSFGDAIVVHILTNARSAYPVPDYFLHSD